MSADSPPEPRTRSFIAASAVFLVLLSTYTLTCQGTFRVDDEHILAARAQSLALWGRLEQPQVFGNDRERELQAMGAAATQIEPGQALLGSGLYRAGVALGWGGAQTLFFQNAFLTAATGAVLVLSVVALGFAPGIGTAVGLLFGLGTFAWPYATTYFRDPLAMFGVALAIHGWVRVSRPESLGAGSGWLMLVAGIVIGVTAKNATLVLLPAFGLMLPALLKRAPVRSRNRWLGWIGGAALVGLLLLLLPKPEPLARFTLNYYLSVGAHFLGSLHLPPPTLISGLLGPFVSPGRSLFLFCPPLFLLAAVPRRWWRGQAALSGAVLLSAAGLALAQVLFYREEWAGAVGWGPRSMLPVLPGLTLLTAPGVERLWAGARGRWAMAGIAAVSFAVQLSAVLVPWQMAYESIRALGLDAYTYAGAWDIRRLLPAHQLPMLPQVEAWSTVWTRLAHSGRIGWVLPVSLSGVGVVVGFWIQRMHRLRVVIMVVSLGSFAILSSAALTWRSDPAWYAGDAELGQAIAFASAEAEAGDVLLVDAYGTPIWFRMLNEWSQPVRWYALPFEFPAASGGVAEPIPDVAALLGHLLGTHARVWLLASHEAPDFLEVDERTWLEQQGRLVSASPFSEGSRHIDVLLFEPR